MNGPGAIRTTVGGNSSPGGGADEQADNAAAPIRLMANIRKIRKDDTVSGPDIPIKQLLKALRIAISRAFVPKCHYSDQALFRRP
jgi:hypothetical protein